MEKIFFYLLFVTLNLSANSDTSLVDFKNIATQGEDFTMWLALFGLGFVALIALFLSSEQSRKFKEAIKNRQISKDKINHAQDQILSQMSENIQNIAEETVATATKISTYDEDIDISSDLAKVVRSENQLLSITTNLIEFLRIKSKKIAIVNEGLKLSNLLNDIAGTLKTSTKDIELELIYDIEHNIPENLNGDTLNLSKIIVNLLLFCVYNNAKEITLKVYKNNIFNKDDNLYFNIMSDVKIDVEDSENIFNANYNEDTNNYDSLGLFIANELSILMNGELIARNDKDDKLEFLLNIPFQENKTKNINIEKIDNKKVLILDSSKNSALIAKKIFTELKHSAKITIETQSITDTPKFSNYDLVVIDEKLFSDKIVEELHKTTCKVISLSNIFKVPKEYINIKNANIQLIKPVIKKQISEAMQEIYLEKPLHEIITHAKVENTHSLMVHRTTFKNSNDISLHSFIQFRKTKILLVEDNIINQKVFVGVLGKSGMDITVANDGEEALEILNKNQKFDIVFMDINMPIMDGYTSTMHIREDSKFNNLPIIALSALTSVNEIDKMFLSGMNGYLPKPLRKEQLFTVFSLFIDETSKDRRVNVRKNEILPILDGLNIRLGISHSSSSEIFYKEILLEFKDAYGDSDKIFKKLVMDFRYAQLQMLCVDIKGLAGSIGAEDMHKLLIEILQLLVYKKHEIIPTFIEPYMNELNKINNSIDKYIN